MFDIDTLASIIDDATLLGDHPDEKTWMLSRGDRPTWSLKLSRLPDSLARRGWPHAARTARLHPHTNWRGFMRLPHEALSVLGLEPGEWLLGVRDWAPGSTLTDVDPARLDTDWKSLARHLCVELRSLHELGVIHGDIQPGNVILTPHGSCQLIDLPLWATTPGERGHVLGSAPLMAPELWDGQPPSIASDVYALATLIAWMSSAKMYPRHANDLPGWARTHTSDAPAALGHLDGKLAGTLTRALAHKPSSRASLQEILDALSIDTAPPPPTTRPWVNLSSRDDIIERCLSHHPLKRSVALSLRAPFGAGKSSTLDELAARLELMGAPVVSMRAEQHTPRHVRLLEQKTSSAGPWRAVIALLGALDAPEAARDALLSHGDQQHRFTRSIDAVLRALPERGVTILWDDAHLTNPDTRAWMRALLQQAQAHPTHPLCLILATSSERPATDLPSSIELALSQPDADWWDGWRAKTMRAELRGLAKGRWEQLITQHGQTIGRVLAQLDVELGNNRRSDTLERASITSVSLEDIDEMLAQGAWRAALNSCQVLHQRGAAPPQELYPRWVDASLRSTHQTNHHATLDACLAEDMERATDELRLELALLRARLDNGRGENKRGLALLELIDSEDLDPTLRARHARWRAQLSLSAGKFDDATEHARHGLSLLAGSPEARPPELLANLNLLVHAANAMRGNTEDIDAIQALLPELAKTGTAQLRARAHSYAAIGLGRAGERSASTASYMAALEEIERAGLDAELPTYLLNVGTAYHSQGRLGLAYEYYARGTRASRETTRATTRILLMRNQADIDMVLGRLGEARELLERAAKLAREHNASAHEVMSTAYLASIHARSGELERARSMLETCSSHPAMQRPDRRAQVLLELARVLLDLDQRLAARRSLEDAAALIDQHDLDAHRTLLGVLRGRARFTHGDELGVMAGIEAYRQSLLRALDAANYRLVLEYSRPLFDELSRQSLPELMEEIADLNQRAINAVAAGLGGKLREDFFANFPPLATTTRAHHNAPPAPSPQLDTTLIERFYRMLSLNEIILHADKPTQLWSKALEIALSLSGAERGFLLLRDVGEQVTEQRVQIGEFIVVASRDTDGDPISRPHLKVSLTIAEEAARTGRTVATVNAREDTRFNAALSVVNLDLTSVLCVPVRDSSGLLGALYLDHRFHPGIFDGESRRMMEAFGHQVALAITNTRQIHDLQQTVTQLDSARAELAELLDEREAMLQGLEQRVARLQGDLERQRDDRGTKLRSAFPRIAYASRSMERVLQQVDRIARSDIPVVVSGESGVGKELIAEAVHMASPRAGGPFVPVNCGAIPETLFESELFGHVKGAFTGATRDRDGLFKSASGGTIFLDELGEMPLAMQVKLLRVLQERRVRKVGSSTTEPIDIRIVAATNRDLLDMVEAGTFRQDLYYRLAAFSVRIPPLAERREDIPLIAHSLLERVSEETIGRRLTLSAAGARLLAECEWPGNVRQLENTLRAASVMCDSDAIGELELAGLIELRGASPRPANTLSVAAQAPARPAARKSGRGRKPKAKKQAIIDALERSDGDVSSAAELLGVSDRTMYRYINKFDLDP